MPTKGAKVAGRISAANYYSIISGFPDHKKQVVLSSITVYATSFAMVSVCASFCV